MRILILIVITVTQFTGCQSMSPEERRAVAIGVARFLSEPAITRTLAEQVEDSYHGE